MASRKDRKEDCVSGELGIRTALVSGGPERGSGAAPGAGGPPQLASAEVRGLGTAATPCCRHRTWRQGGSGHQQAGGKLDDWYHLH